MPGGCFLFVFGVYFIGAMQGLQLLCVIFFALHCGVLAGLDEFLELFEIPYDDFRVEGDGPRSGINNDWYVGRNCKQHT